MHLKLVPLHALLLTAMTLQLHSQDIFLQVIAQFAS